MDLTFTACRRRKPVEVSSGDTCLIMDEVFVAGQSESETFVFDSSVGQGSDEDLL